MVETIAERLAESVLLHERVRAVKVQVEKLDVAPGAVGVKIRRERHADAPPSAARAPMPQSAQRARAPLVAKIGGSLHASPDLARWIEALRRWPHRLTLVPGGGPFADAVRAAQPTLRFSDEAAHAMAVLAMEQYALALADLLRRWTLAETPRGDRRRACRRPHRAVARRRRWSRRRATLRRGWDVTSDSLAAWFARKTRRAALLLIKSVDVGGAVLLRRTLVSAGVVDPAFPAYGDGTPSSSPVPRALATAAQALASGALPGAPVDSATQKIAS